MPPKNGGISEDRSQKPEITHEVPNLDGTRVFADQSSKLVNILASCFWLLASNVNKILVTPPITV
jgi:hypothetical protein